MEDFVMEMTPVIVLKLRIKDKDVTKFLVEVLFVEMEQLVKEDLAIAL